MRFKIDWASLIVGRKCAVLLCFTLYLRAISKYKPLGGLYLEGRFNGGLLRYLFGGLIYLEGLIFGILLCVSGLDTEARGISAKRTYFDHVM